MNSNAIANLFFIIACECTDSTGGNKPCHDSIGNEILILRTFNTGACRQVSLFADEPITKDKKEIEKERAKLEKEKQNALMEEYRKRTEEQEKQKLHERRLALEEERRKNELIKHKQERPRENPDTWVNVPKILEWDDECRSALQIKGEIEPEYRVVDRLVYKVAESMSLARLQWLFRMEWNGPNRPNDQPQQIKCRGRLLQELSGGRPILFDWVNNFEEHETTVGLRSAKAATSIKRQISEHSHVFHLIYGYWTLQNSRILGTHGGRWKGKIRILYLSFFPLEKKKTEGDYNLLVRYFVIFINLSYDNYS